MNEDDEDGDHDDGTGPTSCIGAVVVVVVVEAWRLELTRRSP